MTDYQIPEIPEIESAYRAAHRALEAIVPAGFGFVPEAKLDATEVLSQFPSLVDQAELAVAVHLGPSISWQGERLEGGFDLVTAGADLDNDGEHSFGLTLSDSAIVADHGDSSLEQAARVYRREAGWDFAPGLAGIWLLMLAPVEGFGGGSGPWEYSGHLAGFMILYDRDEDGTYEAIGHIWTARGWRRRGIAKQLLQEARSRFGAREFEHPLTDDGLAFVEGAVEHE